MGGETKPLYPGLGADSTAAMYIGSKYCADGHVVFVVNTDRFFLTHRSSWAVALSNAGARVTVIAEDTGYADRVRALGLSFVQVPFGREHISVLQAMRAAWLVFRFFLKQPPKTVFMVATAAYTLGWPAALILRRTHFVRVIAGAGRALTESGRTSAGSIVQVALQVTSRLKNVSSIFQTTEDLDRFVANRWAKPSASTVIPGTGIDIDVWKPDADLVDSPLVVLFASRLFKEKGIYEFVELARCFNRPSIRFLVVGRPDDGVESGVSLDTLEEWENEGIIEYLGESDDMLSVYKQAHIFVFPSLHPEGTPRVLIEAAACGLAIMASDQPGCRMIVRDGETGKLFDPRSADSINETFASIIDDVQGRKMMAAAARSLIVEQYSLDITLRRIAEFIGLPRRATIGGLADGSS